MPDPKKFSELTPVTSLEAGDLFAIARSGANRKITRANLAADLLGNLGSMANQNASDYLSKAGNLAGLASAAAARGNLGLSSMALEASANYLSKAGNLSGLTSPSTARGNLGLGTIATQNASNVAITGGSIVNTSIDGAPMAGGSGGVDNAGTTIIGADNDDDGVGYISLKTRNIERARINNDGSAQFLFGLFGADKGSQVYNAEAFGAGTGQSGATNTAAIQAAMDAAGVAGGGTVVIADGGVYNINKGSGSFALKFNYDNIRLVIGPGVTLKLADGQMSDGNGLWIIYGTGRMNITIEGGGRLTGNTAGQTGWTAGYSQSGYGRGILLENSVGNIVIRDLTIDDCFSNACEVDGSSAENKAQNVIFENLIVDDVGEGPQMQWVQGLIFHNIVVRNTNNHMVGDGTEVSVCTDFFFDKIRAYNCAGSCVDVFASSRGVVQNFYGENCDVEVHRFGELPDPEDVTVCDGVIRYTADPGIQVFGVLVSGGALKRIKVSNVKAHAGPAAQAVGFIVGAAGDVTLQSDVTFSNNEAYGGATSMRLGRCPNVTVMGNRFKGASGYSVYWEYDGTTDPNQNKNIHVIGNHLDSLYYNDNGSGNGPTLSSIVGNHFSGGGMNVSGVDGIEIHGNTPTLKAGTDGATVTGISVFDFDNSAASGLTQLFGGSKGQRLSIRIRDAVLVQNINTTGGFKLAGAAHWNAPADARLLVEYDETVNRWVEVSRTTF